MPQLCLEQIEISCIVFDLYLHIIVRFIDEFFFVFLLELQI